MAIFGIGRKAGPLGEQIAQKGISLRVKEENDAASAAAYRQAAIDLDNEAKRAGVQAAATEQAFKILKDANVIL